ncbi:MAG: DUF2141 domain-containing protein [Crocinitomicaceae bacterium]|nr:DUF2141 domain-containing protein [Crocinitomicaceae bacterium]
MINSFIKMNLFGFIIFLLSSFVLNYKVTQTIPIIIKNIRNSKGRISIGVFKDASSFEKEKAHKIILVSKKDMINNTVKTTIEIESGVYGLSILDDENSDAKMEYNMVGMPKEGFGFSNYYHSGFTKPNYKQFLVNINPSEKSPIVFQLRYIL